MLEREVGRKDVKRIKWWNRFLYLLGFRGCGIIKESWFVGSWIGNVDFSWVIWLEVVVLGS